MKQFFFSLLLYIGATLQVEASQKMTSEISSTKQNSEPLKISIIKENAPYSLQLPGGRMIGYYVDFWQLWSESNQIEIEFVVGDYQQNMNALKSGSVDFHSGLFSTKSRDEWADYSVPIDRIDTSLFYLDNRISPINNILDAKGLRVAIQPFTSQVDVLPKKYPEIDFIKVNSFDDLISKLINGELDAIVGEVYPLRNAFRKQGAQGIVAQATIPVASDTVYALIPKGNQELVSKINSGIKIIPHEKLLELSKKWVPSLASKSFYQNINNSIGLTKDEKYYLDNLGELNLGIGKFWKPIEFLTDDKLLQGISSDYVARLKSDLGLFLESDYRLSWEQVNEGARNHTIDILSAVGITEERKQYLNFTQPYLKIPMVIVVKRNSLFIQKPNDLIGYSVGASRSNPIKDLWKSNYPSVPLITTQSSSHGLQAVQDGTLDAFIANLITIGPKIKDTYTELEVVAITPHNIEVAIGVRKGLEDLVPIINKWLTSIPQKDKLEIRKVWLSAELKQGKHFFEYAIQWSPFVLFSLLISAFIIRKNIRLSGNIKKRKIIEAQLEQAKVASQIANKNKEQFLANMSHEVRTPINALIGTAHLLEQSGLDRKQQSHIETINFSANSLLMLVEDISDFSKIESGVLTLENKLFSLEKLLNNIFSQANINSSLSEIELSYTLPKKAPTLFQGDSHRVGQIITNILSNSIKFTKAGSIKLEVSLDNPLKLNIKDNRIPLTFKLKDTGIGMSKKQQKLLFKAYSQTDKSIARKYGGTGLGLTICKKLCELMEGSISVKSTPNQGSEFVFTVQLKKTDQKNSEDKNVKQENNSLGIDENKLTKLSGKQILLVDDNKVNLMIAKKILSGYGLVVTTAENGQEGVEIITGKPFDLVLMDIQMPIMDGYQATKSIRKTLNLTLPIVALSANVMENDRRLSKDAGMDAHLGKPIKVDELINTLIRFLVTV